MTMMPDRRTLLAAGLVSIPALLYVGAVGHGATKPCGRAAAQASAAVDSVIRIGRSYLKADLTTAEYNALLRQAALDDEAFHDALVSALHTVDVASKSDFETGNTVSCDGWVLAASEARLCGVIALRAKSKPANVRRIQEKLIERVLRA